MGNDRTAEFEQRYQALLGDKYKAHNAGSLRRFLEGEAKLFWKKAEAARGVDTARFHQSVASIEKVYQILDMLEDALKEAAA